MGVEDFAIDCAREGLRMALLLGAPALLAAVVAGLLIGAAQTLTQMQEPTAGIVMRIVVVAVVVLAVLPWLAARWASYAAEQISSITQIL